MSRSEMPVKWRFMLIFIFLSVGVAAVGSVFYARQKAVVIHNEKNAILSIARLKQEQIERWWKERTGDAGTIFDNPLLAHDVDSYMADRKNAHLGSDLYEYLNAYRVNYNYVIARLLDPSGAAVISDPSDAYPLSHEAKETVLQAVAKREIVFSDLVFEEEEKVIHMHIAVPIINRHRDKDGVVGAVLLAVDPSRFLFPLVQTWPVPSRTAETLLVRREGNEVVYLNELRYRKETALKLRLPISQADLPAAAVVAGRQGVMWGRDYRGVAVLAAALPIPGTSWFIVAKMDESEVLRPVRRIAAFSLVVAFLLIAASGMSILHFWRKHQWQSEEALRKSEERYGAILDISPEAFFINRNDRIVYVNRAALKLFGAGAPGEVLGKTPYDIFHPDYHGIVRERIRLMLEKGGQAPLIEEKVVRLNGSVVDVEVVAGPFTDDSGPAIMVFLREITARKKAEDEVKKINAELEWRVAERTRELESFSYSVSHDLRAPLRAIDGFSSALFEDCAEKLGDKGKEHLSRIRKGVANMSGLIDDMLSLSRVTMADMRSERVDLNRVALEILSSLRSAEPGRDVEFSAAPDISVNGDPHLLRVLLGNLIGNAWKFTSRNSAARIEFGMNDVEGVRVYFVKDNGAGFDMAYADKLFVPFQRLHSASEFAGNGIGLVTAKRIVGRHGGKIWAEASPDKGATFFFTL